MKIEKPISLTIASLATGLFLGMIPLIHTAITDMGDPTKVTAQDLYWDLAYTVLWALSFGVGVVTWCVALQGKRDARALLEAIKSRPSRPMA